MLTKLHLTIPMLALVAACCPGGATPPVRPVVTERGPCLTRPRSTPPVELMRIADVGDLTAEQEAWLWTYVEVLESYADRAWRLCGRPAVKP